MARATGYCRNKEGSRDSQLIHNCSVELSRLGLWEGRMQGGWARRANLVGPSGSGRGPGSTVFALSGLSSSFHHLTPPPNARKRPR